MQTTFGSDVQRAKVGFASAPRGLTGRTDLFFFPRRAEPLRLSTRSRWEKRGVVSRGPALFPAPIRLETFRSIAPNAVDEPLAKESGRYTAKVSRSKSALFLPIVPATSIVCVCVSLLPWFALFFFPTLFFPRRRRKKKRQAQGRRTFFFFPAKRLQGKRPDSNAGSLAVL